MCALHRQRGRPRLANLGRPVPTLPEDQDQAPLVDWNPETRDVEALRDLVEAGLAEYRRDYAAYYERHQRRGSAPDAGPEPTVVLVPGLGMIAWERRKASPE